MVDNWLTPPQLPKPIYSSSTFFACYASLRFQFCLSHVNPTVHSTSTSIRANRPTLRNRLPFDAHPLTPNCSLLITDKNRAAAPPNIIPRAPTRSNFRSREAHIQRGCWTIEAAGGVTTMGRWASPSKSTCKKPPPVLIIGHSSNVTVSQVGVAMA